MAARSAPEIAEDFSDIRSDKLKIYTLPPLFFVNRINVTEEGCTWICKEAGFCITFFPKAVTVYKRVKCSLWSSSAVSPTLEKDSTLVSNVIELTCEDSAGINYDKVTVALSHSVRRRDLRGRQLVMKESIHPENETWKDLDTAVCEPPGMQLLFIKLINK